MANKRPKPEEIVTKLGQVEVLTGQGMPRLDAIRQIGVTEQTYYRWKKKYGGMGTEQLNELKRLQKENERLIPALTNQNLYAQFRHPIDVMRSGSSMSLFQASQQSATMSS